LILECGPVLRQSSRKTCNTPDTLSSEALPLSCGKPVSPFLCRTVWYTVDASISGSWRWR
jgi:hypothetical protein